MLTLKKKPYFWVSAHRDITFTYDYQTVGITFLLYSEDGKLALFGNPFSEPINVGDYLYVTSGIYKGYHLVTEILSSISYVTATDYTTADLTTLFAKLIKEYEFVVNKGYATGSLEPYLPFEELARFKPEPNADGLLVFNISGYVNKIFDTVNSNDKATIGLAEVWYNLFNRITLYLNSGGTLSGQSEHMALNSAIDMYELNQQYVDTGRYINGGVLGNFFSTCGTTVNQKITSGLVVTATEYEGIAAPVNDTEFDSGFSNGFYKG